LDSPLTYTKEDAWVNMDGVKPVHKKGIGLNVGSLLSNDQYKYYKDGHITSDGYGKYLDELYEIASATSFWATTRKRALDKYVHNDVMVAEMIPVQTVTQRSGSRLWSVVPNPSKTKIGSDFKNLIESRPGYKLCGFDFDSF